MKSMIRVWVPFAQLRCRYRFYSSSTKETPPPVPHQDMDFLKAADILLSESPRKKKFGWDFHLWQFFVACLPSVAVYLTAQYARKEMRRMEKEREIENAEKLRNETKDQIKAADKLPELQSIEARLESMEEKIKEIEAMKEKLIAVAFKEAKSTKSNEGEQATKPGVTESKVHSAVSQTDPTKEVKDHNKHDRNIHQMSVSQNVPSGHSERAKEDGKHDKTINQPKNDSVPTRNSAKENSASK